MKKLKFIVRKLTEKMGKLASIDDRVYIPFDVDEGVSHRNGFMWNEKINCSKKALETLHSWEVDSDHVLEAYTVEEAADLCIRGRNICNLHDSINKSSLTFKSEILAV